MYRLELSNQNRPVLLAYLRRSRRFRVVPAAIIWAVSGGSLLTDDPLPLGLDDSGLGLYAYFAGAALAVLTLPAYRPSNSTRVARLESRSINDYLAPHVRKLLWGSTMLVLALLPIYAIVAEWARELPGPRTGDTVRPVGSMVPVVIVALHLVALGALLLTVSSIVSAFRPEPWWFGRRHTERVAA